MDFVRIHDFYFTPEEIRIERDNFSIRNKYLDRAWIDPDTRPIRFLTKPYLGSIRFYLGIQAG